MAHGAYHSSCILQSPLTHHIFHDCNIEHKVCQKDVTSKTTSSRKRNRLPGTFPYPKLEPNSKFITPFGVVAVISDSRMPSDHNQTCVPEDIKEKNKVYTRKLERIEKRKLNFMIYHAKLQRKRRMELMQIYLGDAKKDNEGHDGNTALQIWKQYCTLTTPRMILSGKYSQTLDNKILNQVKTIENHPWNDAGDDPSVPTDSYPDRIVECVLINDERVKVCDLEIESEGEGRLSQIDAARKSVEEAKGIKSKKNEDGINTNVPLTVKNRHESGMKLFLNRKTLVHVYNEKVAIYRCQKCGQTFSSRSGLKGHLNELTCIKRSEKFSRERLAKLQEIEEAVLKDEIRSPQPYTTPNNNTATPVQQGSEARKSKRKKHKKWPAWLEFYPALSPIYPETFQFMQFKRGSNNTKFLQKKWDEIGQSGTYLNLIFAS